MVRLAERGATQGEVRLTVETGGRFPAKFGRHGFRRNFPCEGVWRGRAYTTKQPAGDAGALVVVNEARGGDCQEIPLAK